MRKITISGNLGNEPELRKTNGGLDVASFSIAVRQTRADQQGNYGTDWFRCSVWGKRANTIINYYHKGNHVVVTGDLEINEYKGKTQLGVNVNDFDLPDSNQASTNQQPSNQANPFESAGDPIDISDDDMPF